jgi:hypothetical protein
MCKIPKNRELNSWRMNWMLASTPVNNTSEKVIIINTLV